MKRRFATMYYKDHGSRADLIARGAAVTVRGAITAGVPKVFLNEYGEGVYMLVHDRVLDLDIIQVTVHKSTLSVEWTTEAKAEMRGIRGVK